MLSLILMIIIGLGITFFAMQNTSSVTLSVGNYVLRGIPLYLVSIGSLFVGLVIAAFINAIDFLSSSWTIRGKNTQLNRSNQAINQLEEKMHNLEVENAQLRGENQEIREETHEQPHTEPVVVERKEYVDDRPRLSFFDRLRHSF